MARSAEEVRAEQLAQVQQAMASPQQAVVFTFGLPGEPPVVQTVAELTRPREVQVVDGRLNPEGES